MINTYEKHNDSGAARGQAVRRVAFYGGTFDPLHNGHFAIGKALGKQFALNDFIFVPAFHAPHKTDRRPTSPFHRFAMLANATADDAMLSVSPTELEMPERPFTVETLERLLKTMSPREIYFVMGADSWRDICTWREWERVLTMTNHIVVTRPGHSIETGHVTERIRNRIVDLRDKSQKPDEIAAAETKIYFSDAVESEASASIIRSQIKQNLHNWRVDVPDAVAKYIEKYELYT